MTISIRTLFLFASSFIFSVFTPVSADSYYKHTHYFLAPDITSSGTVVNGVDVSSGKLNRSDSDLTSSTLTFSRIFSGSGLKANALGGWNHNYSSQLVVNGLSHANWRGIKSNQYNGKSKACTSGWNDIKGSLFNGQLSSAKAKYRRGVCQISKSNKTVAEFIIHSSKSTSNSLVLSRPDGSTMSFVKSGRYWKTLSGAPFSLNRSGRNWKVKTPSDSVETYNRNGKLVRITNSSGQTTRLSYKSGKLDKVTGAFGKTLQLTYQNGKLDKVVGALGTVSYTYTGDLLTSVTKVDGSTMGYQYNGNKLTAVVDALGQTTASYAYDNSGRVITASGQNDTRKTSFDYTSSGVEVTNVANNATDSYDFSVIRGVMKLTSSTNVDGSTTTQSYDKNGYPKESIAINGTKTQTDYNDRGLLVKRIESVGLDSEKITITEWHKDYRKPVLQVEDALVVGNKATQSTYNGKGLLVKRIEGVIKKVSYSHHGSKHGNHKGHGKGHHGHNHKPTITLKDKRITRYRYNSKGQIVKTIAPNGAVTLTSYDADGNRTGGANALGHENKTLSFDATGKPLLLEDANGIQTSNVYDSAGRLSSSISNGRTTTFAYDAAGREVNVTYSDGSSTSNEYDASGNLTKTIDQDGNVTQSIFDSNGNQTSTQITDDQGTVILSSASEYNNKNQLVKSIDAQGNETTYVYDAQGNQISVTDANGNTTQDQYDANNRLVKMIDSLGGETTYVYDANGSRIRVTTPNGAIITFAYDSFDQLILEVSADRGRRSYQYGNSGNQTQLIDANGNQKNVSYDVLNRKTGEIWTDAPDLTITYSYDNCANGVGKLCSVIDKSGSTTFAYDAKGQIAKKTQNIDGIELTKTYVYNNEGKLISETYPSGTVISYAYNADKVRSISIDGNPYITGISYNAANQLVGWNWADGTSYTKTYDGNGRLSSFPLGNDTRTLTYDTNGNITSWTDNGKTEIKSFAYDALNRLTEYNKAHASTKLEDQLFSYDANGNRTQLEENTVQTVYSILANSNRLLQVGSNSYLYDANGNVIDDGEHTYSYDARNRLIGIDGTSTYLFNANNMRVKKTTPAGAVLYGWDNDRIFAEYDDKGDAIQETVYFGSTPVALLKDGNIHRIYADQIDKPRIITDSSNTALWAWESKPFGESLPNEDVDADGINLSYNLRFPGQYYDIETGKYYNFNRDYNPVTGRYIQSDPIGLDGGNNTFRYAGNNPLTTTDSSGLQPTWVSAAGRKIDISIDVHNEAEKNDALNIINAYRGQIYFTVYIYSRDTNWLPELKAAGALVGFHVNPRDIANPAFGPVVDQINKYFGTYRWAQPVSIHGLAGTRLQPNEMSLLASFNVPFVRAADNTGSSGGYPPVKLTHSTCHTASSIISGAKHYFFHTLSSNDGCKTRVDNTLSGLGFTK